MGREEGLLESIQAGRREGRHRGLQEALLSQSEVRFGALPAAFRRKIQRINSDEQLHDLLGRVLTATTRQDLGLG